MRISFRRLFSKVADLGWPALAWGLSRNILAVIGWYLRTRRPKNGHPQVQEQIYVRSPTRQAG